MTREQELIYRMALSKVPGVGRVTARRLLDAVDDISQLFEDRSLLKERIPFISDRLVAALDCPELLARAEKELDFSKKNQITVLTFRDEEYPSRLRECEDAPLLLFYKGNSTLNNLKVVSVVGTRHITDYGKEMVATFIRELSSLCPGVLIVSGLAYGVDIHAHRAALTNGLDTVAVLAHGLDRIYPSVHRKTAVNMLQHGGLLTEYTSGTNPDPSNFVCRNRIVAGMCDATIVVESAKKGGALITADIANSYARDCFAFPGRARDLYSVGCNQLIKNNKAALIQSAADFVEAMGWEPTPNLHSPTQREAFVELSNQEQVVVNLLMEEDKLHINTLVVKANIPVNKMSALLFELELKGVVRTLAGGVYQLMHN